MTPNNRIDEVGDKQHIFNMPIEVRDYVPEDTIFIVNKGKANWVKKTDGSEVIAIIKRPQIETIKQLRKK